jgi:hypothetical protein
MGPAGGTLNLMPRRFACRGRRATSSRTCGGRVTACIVTESWLPRSDETAEVVNETPTNAAPTLSRRRKAGGGRLACDGEVIRDARLGLRARSSLVRCARGSEGTRDVEC